MKLRACHITGKVKVKVGKWERRAPDFRSVESGIIYAKPKS